MLIAANRKRYHLQAVKRMAQQVDWRLLIFLLLFLDVKLVVKAAAVLFAYAVRPDFRFGFRLRCSRLPLFYPVAGCIALLNVILMRLYLTPAYFTVLLTGLFCWMLCILAVHQVKLSVENSTPLVIYKTLVLFFLLNAALSVGNLMLIMIETGAFNPYRYQGNFQQYFIGTGDYIRGIFFDTSTTNAIINAFGLLYFLNRSKALMTFVCMAVLLLTGSNVTNLLLVAALNGLFIFKSTHDQKSVILVCLLMLVVFLAKVSPENNQYAIATIENAIIKKDISGSQTEALSPLKSGFTDISISAEEMQRRFAQHMIDSVQHSYAVLHQPAQTAMQVRETGKHFTKPVNEHQVVLSLATPRQTIIRKNQVAVETTGAVVAKPVVEKTPQATAEPWKRPTIPEPDINSFEYQSRSDTTPFQSALMAFMKEHHQEEALARMDVGWEKRPGKWIGLMQTFHFMHTHPWRLMTGNGMGTFSSKLALKATALKIAGGFPQSRTYINSDFNNNHLALYLYYLTRRTGFHSVMNTPDSVYDQLLAEYGIAGLISFLVFYAWFFISGIKRFDHLFFLSLIMALILMLGYWFEQLSVVIVFELLMFAGFKEMDIAAVNKNRIA